jgi:hypothetical protein
MIRRRMWFLVMLASTALCAACDHLCTLIGCVNGLTVEFEDLLPNSLAVEVLDDEHAPPAQHLTNTSEYGAVAYFEDYHPTDVTIRVSWATASITASARPEYHEWRPNGPDCDPECRSAYVLVDLNHLRRSVLPQEN